MTNSVEQIIIITTDPVTMTVVALYHVRNVCLIELGNIIILQYLELVPNWKRLFSVKKKNQFWQSFCGWVRKKRIVL